MDGPGCTYTYTEVTYVPHPAQSAQRSRMRKLAFISELEGEVSVLAKQIQSLNPKLDLLNHERKSEPLSPVM